MRLLFSSTLILALVAGSAQAQERCEHQADRSQTLDVSGARLLDLTAGSGSLTVTGKAGLTRVVLRGKACASSADLLREIKLEASRSGSAIVVRSNIREENHQRNWRDNEYARLDLVVEVPAGFAADIVDGSGEIELSNLGAVEVEDGSGQITAHDLASARIVDGSGEIELSDVTGRVDIEDGSGEITLRNIGGAIDIEDGSGEVNVRVARSSVRIRDGSGSIDVGDVAGDLIVEDDGSGGIDYANVRGRVDVPRKKRR